MGDKQLCRKADMGDKQTWVTTRHVDKQACRQAEIGDKQTWVTSSHVDKQTWGTSIHG